jgi:N-acyl-D-aspartate/D-glutamate deacylase
MRADVTVFNSDTIIDTATFQDPIRFPEGVEYVFVNGEMTVDRGEHTGARAGAVLRHRR